MSPVSHLEISQSAAQMQKMVTAQLSPPAKYTMRASRPDIGTIFPRDYMHDGASSCNAGLAYHLGEERSPSPSEKRADTGAARVRGGDRLDLRGRHRAG